MHSRRKLRKDRVFAVLIIICIPFILLLIFAKKTETQSSPVQTNSVQTSVSTTCTTTSAVTTTQPSVTFTHIDSPQCRAAALVSVDDNRLIYSDNIYEKTAPASLTKLLTAAVALKYADGNLRCTVGSEQWLVNPYSSLCGLEIGDVLTLEQLITGMLMSSGNDAAYTAAVSAARYINPYSSMSDEEAVAFFCGLMNEFAASLGMTGSHFVNPDGWDDTDEYTTVSDLIKLAEYALTVPEIREMTGQFQTEVTAESGRIFSWTNSNQLLNPYSIYYCPDAAGMKTGTTEYAGNCLISAFERNGKTYISVVVGCVCDADRYELTRKLISELDKADKPA